MSNSIGSWNGRVFKVSSSKIFSLSDISVKRSSRWATHDIIGKVPKMEFQGMDQIAVECKIILDATLGVKPIEEAENSTRLLIMERQQSLLLQEKLYQVINLC